MVVFVLRRVGIILLTALTLSFIVFALTNLPSSLGKLAKAEGSVRMSDEEVQRWLDENGFGGSMVWRYGEWLGVAPAACVYLDDLGINCKPAAALGMTAIKVTGEAQALADLAAATGLRF